MASPTLKARERLSRPGRTGKRTGWGRGNKNPGPENIRPRQSADKACKRKNCPEQREIRGNFCSLRPLHMQPAVTYAYVSSLVCKFASLSCRLSHHSGSLLTLSISCGYGYKPIASER